MELKNRNGRSAGLSNAAEVLAGEAPAPVTGLNAEVRKDGVVLRWTPDGAGSWPIRLQRKLLTPPPTKTEAGSAGAAAGASGAEAAGGAAAQGAGIALDKSIRFGETYEYRAQRVARVRRWMARRWSWPESFPRRCAWRPRTCFRRLCLRAWPPWPATGESGAEPAIDLSWQPDTETDLAGYIVYRREGDAAWQRISPAQPVVGPAFHDAHVQAGHTYIYAVSAIDQSGHESARSAEAQETVPEP